MIQDVFTGSSHDLRCCSIKASETRAHEENNVNSGWIDDHTRNARPARPVRHLSVILGVFGSLMLSIGLAQEQNISLEGALKALRETPDWRLADLNFDSAQRSLDAARASAGLNLSAGGRFDTSLRTDGGTSADPNASVSVTLSANLLPWSPAHDQIRSAERSLERAALDRRDTRNSLVLSTVSTYFTARTAELSLALARATEALSEARLRVAKAQQQNGQITLSALLDAQRALETARSDSLSARNSLEINLAQLGLVAGTKLSTAPQALDLPQGTPEALIQAAWLNRSDVQKAISRLRDAEDTLANAQRDRWLPNANLSLGFGSLSPTGQLGSPSVNTSINLQNGTATVTGQVPVTSSNVNATGISLGVTASFPILAPSNDARINTAQAALEVAKAALESARRAAALDVVQRLSDASTAQTRLAVSRSALETAKKNLETAAARNQAGLNTTIDLESARVGVLQAERDLDNALAAQMIAVYRLQNAIGTLDLVPENRTKTAQIREETK
jgi:outer membrane protein TolC